MHQVQDANGDSLLHVAVRYGHIDIADFLVSEYGFEVDLTKDGGVTPLYIAAQ